MLLWRSQGVWLYGTLALVQHCPASLSPSILLCPVLRVWWIQEVSCNSRVTSWFQRTCAVCRILQNVDVDSFRKPHQEMVLFLFHPEALWRGIAHRLKLFPASLKWNYKYIKARFSHPPKCPKCPKPCTEISQISNLLNPWRECFSGRETLGLFMLLDIVQGWLDKSLWTLSL